MAHYRIAFKLLQLWEDEENWGTHMAVYADLRRKNASGGIWADPMFDFRWNNHNGEVDEGEDDDHPAEYALDQEPASIPLDLSDRPTLWIEGYANDDEDWPGRGHEAENSLGGAEVTLEPDPSGPREYLLGPTTTDQRSLIWSGGQWVVGPPHKGFAVKVRVTPVPDPPPPPHLKILGVEITQGIQEFRVHNGKSDNPVRLVAARTTLVRVYLRAGTQGADAAGRLTGVSGHIRIRGDSTYDNRSDSNITALASDIVDPLELDHTLNFTIPSKVGLHGHVSIAVEAVAPSGPTVTYNLEADFHEVRPLRIRVVRFYTNEATETMPVSS